MANSKLGISLLMSGLGIVGAGLLLGLFYAPSVSSNEWNAPEAYRIIFWHVPTAWTSFLTFGMLFIGIFMNFRFLSLIFKYFNKIFSLSDRKFIF